MNKLFLFLIVFCLAPLAFAQELTVDTERFDFTFMDKPAMECQYCSFPMTLCNDVSVNDPTLSFTYKDERDTVVNTQSMITRQRYMVEKIIDQPNGTRERITSSHSLAEIRSYIDSLSFGECADITYEFTLKPGSSVDVIPIYDNTSYEEYAWFFAPLLNYTQGGFYFPFDDSTTSGTNAGEKLGNSTQLNCTIQGVFPYSNSSQYGIYVNGSYGHVGMNGSTGSPFCDVSAPTGEMGISTATSWSMRAWFKHSPDVSVNRFLTFFNDGAGFLQFDTTNTAGHLECEVRSEDGTNEIGLESTTVINDSQWHSAVCTYDASQDNFYLAIDGDIEQNVSSAGWFVDFIGIPTVRVGQALAPGQQWNGTIDEVAFFKQWMTPQQIIDFHNISNVSNATPAIHGVNCFDRAPNSTLQQGYNYTFDYNCTANDTASYHSNNTFINITTDTGIVTANLTTPGIYYTEITFNDSFSNFYKNNFTLNITALVVPNQSQNESGSTVIVNIDIIPLRDIMYLILYVLFSFLMMVTIYLTPRTMLAIFALAMGIAFDAMFLTLIIQEYISIPTGPGIVFVIFIMLSFLGKCMLFISSYMDEWVD